MQKGQKYSPHAVIAAAFPIQSCRNLASSPENLLSVLLFLTGIASAFFWPTSTTTFCPL
jgi:hypothetical protein